MSEITDFDVTDANNTGRWPENMQFSAVNDAGRADEGILARWFADTNGSIVASGSSNAFAITSNRTIGALFDNLKMSFTANHSITGDTTLNLNGIGAKSLKGFNGSELGSGAIVDGQVVDVIYKVTPDAWFMISAPAPLTHLGSASDTVQGIIEIAVQSELEAASDNARAVPPGRMRFHPGVAKCWGVVTYSGGTPTLQTSLNIASITDAGQGLLTVTIDVDFSSSHYVLIGLIQTDSGTQAQICTVVNSQKSAGSFQLALKTYLDNFRDPQSVSFVCFGDQ